MTELNNTGCMGVGQVEMQGKVIARDLEIVKEGITYIISVATPGYIADIRHFNQGLDPEVQLDDRIYPVEDVSNVEQICAQLSTLPSEALQPFLTEQVQSMNDGQS